MSENGPPTRAAAYSRVNTRQQAPSMPANGSPIRAVAYYRMSTDKQEDSIPQQREWVLRAARAAGIDLLAEFQDDGIPGAEIERRSGLMALMDFCESRPAGRHVQAVIVWDTDRLSRANSIRTAALIDRLMSAGVSRLFTPEGWIDFEDDMDLLVFNIKQDTSKAGYSKAMAKNVTRSALQRARLGYWPSARPPYGYRAVPTNPEAERPGPGRKPPKLCKLQPDPALEDVVRWIFDRYAYSAASLGDVARELTLKGVAPPRAARWNRDTVRAILRNRAYVGDIVWNARTRARYYRVEAGDVQPVRGARPRRGRPSRVNEEASRVVIENTHPALIDRQTFATCASKLPRARWVRTTPVAGGGEWVLSGLAYCSVCGGRMCGERRNGAEPVLKYVCHGNARNGCGTCKRYSARQDVILHEIGSIIRETFTDPEKTAALRADAEAFIAEQAKDEGKARQQLQQQLDRLDKHIAKCRKNMALADDADALRHLAAQAREWEEERETVSRDLARAEAAAAEGQQFRLRAEGLLGQLVNLEQALASGPAADARDLLAPFVQKVTLHFVDRPQPDPRSRLVDVEVEFRPEVCSLLGIPRRPRSGGGPCRARTA